MSDRDDSPVVLRTMGWRFEGRVAVTVHGPRNPADDEWDAYIAAIQSLPELSETRALVYTEGGGPNAAQRGRLIDVFQFDADATVRTAFVATSRLMRGIGTAVSWFNPGLKVFNPNDLNASFEYLQLDPAERSLASRAVASLQQRLRGPERSAG